MRRILFHGDQLSRYFRVLSDVYVRRADDGRSSVRSRQNAALFCDQRCIHLGENTAGHDFEQLAAGFLDGIWWAFTISSVIKGIHFLSVFCMYPGKLPEDGALASWEEI